MPTERQKLAMQRRISRERFLKARIVEREFAVQLSNAGRQVGQIIKGFERDGKITDMAGLKASLDAYSKTLEPWAKAVVARMQAQVARRDLTAWQQLSKSIGSELHRVIEGAPIGLQLRSMMELQVSLITSLPIEAARRVHTLTLEGITQGRRAEDVQRDIMDSGHVTVSRAKLIARTEVARTASVLTQARATYVGSDSYFWRSSEDSDVRPALGSKHFAEMNTFERGSHRKLDGTIQRWDHPPIAGPQGQRAHPGQIFNCRCFSGDTLVSFPSGLRMLWRMPFDGNIHRITVAGQSFDCTPNHPILTDRGWHPAHDLKRGDYVIQAISDPLFTVEHDKYNRLVSFSDLFEALAIGTITTPQGEANFYGDLPCNDVDTIPVEFLLDKSFEASASDSFSDFNLSESKCSLPLVPVIHANLTEPPSYRPTIDAESLRERQLAFSRLISTGDLSHRKMLSSIAMTNATASRNFHPDSADLFAQVVSTHAKDGRGLFEHESRRYKFLPFENQVVRKFSSHVFTMQTYSGWYGISPLSIIARNCWPEPILPDY